jgi:AraC-like DNA-binding protein
MSGQPERMPGLDSPRQPMPGRWVLAGAQTRPVSSWCPGPAHGMMAMFLPDAFQALTGLPPAALTDRFVDASEYLPPDWLALCAAVQEASDDAQRLLRLEDFLRPRWLACRPVAWPGAQRLTDWTQHLAQRAAFSAAGRSLRQAERRIKGWAGLPLRELRGLARAERAFFEMMESELAQQAVKWADVAVGAGYADQSHLSRITRRITGYAPQALYEGIRGDEAFWIYRLWAQA